VRLAFLTPYERETHACTVETIHRAAAEVERLRTMQADVQWGRRQMDEAMQERLRQFLASRSEIAAGDRMVLGTLKGKARERQRYWLGVPLLAVGAGLTLWVVRVSRPGRA
jgi:zinc/manganese transport system permease protein